MKNARNFNIARLWNASRILLDSNANMKISNLNVKVSYTNDDFDITRLWNASRILPVSVSFVFWPFWHAVLLYFSFFSHWPFVFLYDYLLYFCILLITFCIFVFCWLPFVFLYPQPAYYLFILALFCLQTSFWPESETTKREVNSRRLEVPLI